MHEIWRLRHFLGVAEAGSFHAAARQMNISQPALTKSVRLLEAAFGTELFMRLPRGIRLTEAGENLHKRAREIEASWNAAVLEVGAQAHGMGGFMRIGGGPVYSAAYFPDVLADLRRGFPNLRVSVLTGVGSELLPKLKMGDIRAYAGGVPEESADMGPQFVTDVLYNQSNAIFAASDHPLFQQDRITAPDTLKFPWLSLFSGHQANIRIEDFFSRLDQPAPALALEAHSIQIALQMLADHRFIACMPAPMASIFPGTRLREIDLPGFRWSIPTGITYHRASTGFAPIVTMLRSLRRLTSSL